MNFDAQRRADDLLVCVDIVAKRLGWTERFEKRETSVIEATEEGKPKAITLSFTTVGIGVDIGVLVPGRSIISQSEVPGYRVWEIQGKPATRSEPEDAWDVDLLLTQSPAEALEKLFSRVVSHTLNGAFLELSCSRQD